MMRKYVFVLLLFACVYGYSQTISTRVDTTAALAKFGRMDPGNSVVQIEKTHVIPEIAFAQPLTAADSASFGERTVEIKERIVRFDPEMVRREFPEVVTIDYFDNPIIDYDSFIPILLKMLSEQQLLIEDLKSRIQVLETTEKRAQ